MGYVSLKGQIYLEIVLKHGIYILKIGIWQVKVDTGTLDPPKPVII